MSTPSSTKPFVPPSLATLGALLPGYAIIDFIAQGGMGAVYLARQLSLDRLVAIKVLPPLDGEADASARFKSEARAMARLTHNHIVSVFDFGVTREGHHYLVMEYVDGETLHDAIQRHHLNPVLIRTIALELCDALIFAHDHGIIHRDIKPANILLSRDGHAKIADFGLARQRASASARDPSRLGTPEYAAPEIFIHGRKIDHRADIYALGILIYEMLLEQIPDGSGQAPSAIRPSLAPWDNVFLKATQSDARHRFRDMHEMRAAIAESATATQSKKLSSQRLLGSQRLRASQHLRDEPPRPALSTTAIMGLASAFTLMALAFWFWSARNPSPPGPDPVTSAPLVATALPIPPATAEPGVPATPAPRLPDDPFHIRHVPVGHVSQLQVGHKEPISSIVLFPDQRRAASVSLDGTAKIWDLVRGETLQTFGPFESALQNLALSSDGRFLAAGSQNHTLRVWNTASGELHAQAAVPGKTITALAFSQDDRWLLCAANDLGASLHAWPWQESPGHPLSLSSWKKIVTALCPVPGPGENRFFSVGGGRDQNGLAMEFHFGRLPSPSPLASLKARAQVPSRAAAAPGGRLVAITQGTDIVIIDTASDADVAICKGHDGFVETLKFLDGGRLLISGSQDKTIRLWETVSGREVHRFEAPTWCTSHLAVSQDETWLVSAGGIRFGSPSQTDGDNSLHLWRLPVLHSLVTEQGWLAEARSQLDRLEEIDPPLAALRNRFRQEWQDFLQQHAPQATQAALAELTGKYVNALRREMPKLSLKEQEYCAHEIARVGGKSLSVPDLSHHWPESLRRLSQIYAEQSRLLSEKPRQAFATLAQQHLQAIQQFIAARDAGDPLALARARLVQQEIQSRRLPAANAAPPSPNPLQS